MKNTREGTIDAGEWGTCNRSAFTFVTVRRSSFPSNHFHLYRHHHNHDNRNHHNKNSLPPHDNHHHHSVLQNTAENRNHSQTRPIGIPVTNAKEDNDKYNCK